LPARIIAANAPALVVFVALVVVAGAFAAGAFIFDDGDGGLRRSTPATIHSLRDRSERVRQHLKMLRLLEKIP
jgi:hypothetical protein